MADLNWSDQAVAGLINELGDLVRYLYDRITNSVSSTIGDIAQRVESIVDLVRLNIYRAMDTITRAFENVVGSINDYISTFIDSVSLYVQDIYESVLSEVTTTLNNITDGIVEFIQGSVDSIADLIDSAAASFNDIYNSVVGFIEESFSAAADYLYGIYDQVVGYIDAIVTSAGDYLAGIYDQVSASVGGILDSAQNVVSSIESGIEYFINEVTGPIGTGIVGLLDTIGELPTELSQLAESLFNSAKENIADPIANIPVNLINSIMEKVSGDPLSEVERLQLGNLTLLLGQSPVPRTRAQVRALVEDMIPQNPLLKSLVIMLVTPFIIAQTYSGIAAANSQIILQEHAIENPYRLLEPADAILAGRYGLLNYNDVKLELQRTGYDEQAAAILDQISRKVAPEGELISWMLRGLITDDKFTDDLHKLGWHDEDISLLRQSAYFIPPVGDLITMAVREVFSPDIAEQFGQYEDFPPEFVEHAAKQGVDSEWARRYWAAHWSLPSVQMAFEMLHRDVIDQPTLDLLLRASDIMPFWRDKLTAISYNPLTRVDVRRMHKLGVLSDAEVTRAYKDIGYNEENAQRLTDFTIALNEGPDTTSAEELSSLTRTNIIAFYTDGLITRETAFDTLLLAGIDATSAELFITSAELSEERKIRKDSIDVILSKAKTGALTNDQANDALNTLDLGEAERQKALEQLSRLNSARPTLPSKQDLDKMLAQGILSTVEYRNAMALLGYSDYWIDKYLTLSGAN